MTPERRLSHNSDTSVDSDVREALTQAAVIEAAVDAGAAGDDAGAGVLSMGVDSMAVQYETASDAVLLAVTQGDR